MLPSRRIPILFTFTDDSSPSFFAPLLTSLVLSKGIGDPTFTRATTATVTDFEGLMKTAKSGEARFEGARRVENLIPTPSNTLAVAGTKTITVTAGTYVFSMGAGGSAGVATFSGTSGVNGVLTQHATNRVSAPLYNLAAGSVIITASVADLNDLQLENVTGQANQNPSEYVSVGVLSAPYHGAGADGVKYFTTQNGNTTTVAQGAAMSRGAAGGGWDGTDHGYYAYPPNTANTAEETLANIIANKLGFMYQWSGANGNICPKGWHLPTDAEQNILDQYLTDSGQTCDAARSNAWDCSTVGTKLKTGGTSGMNIPLAGYRLTGGSFSNRATDAYLWSSLQSGGNAWYRNLTSSEARVRRYTSSKAFGFSVRCLKDSNNTDPATTIYDADGNSYGVVTVGTQTWLDANLMNSHYVQYVVTEATGSDIPDATLHGYVAEGERTNLNTYSEAPDNYNKYYVTTSTDTAVSPAGTLTAEKVIATTTDSTHVLYKERTVSNSTTYTFSVYVKAAGYNFVVIGIEGAVVGGTTAVYINLTNGTLSDAYGSGVSSAQSVGNGWYRVSTTFTTNGTSIQLDMDVAQSAGIVSFAGDGTSGIYLWGAQLEAGAFASSYIPTTTASVTRNTDVLTYPTAGNQSETAGSAYAEVTASSWANVAGQYIGDGTESLLFSLTTNSGVKIYDGTNTVNGPTGTPSGQMKLASTWSGSALKAYASGVAGTAGSYDGAFTLASLGVGSSYYGTIRNVKIWKKALTDSKLISLTT